MADPLKPCYCGGEGERVYRRRGFAGSDKWVRCKICRFEAPIHRWQSRPEPDPEAGYKRTLTVVREMLGEEGMREARGMLKALREKQEPRPKGASWMSVEEHIPATRPNAYANCDISERVELFLPNGDPQYDVGRLCGCEWVPEESDVPGQRVTHWRILEDGQEP